MGSRGVIVGRGTPFGNPVKMRVKCPVCGRVHYKPGDTIGCFRLYLAARILPDQNNEWGIAIAKSLGLPGATLEPKDFIRKLLTLRGRVLYCPGCGENSSTCHARVLEKAVKYLLTL